MNRAVHGDIVAVEVFSEQEWKAPTEEVVDQECEFRIKSRRTPLINLKPRIKTTMPRSLMRREKGSSWKKRLQELKFLREHQPRSSPQAALSVSSKGTGERRWSVPRYTPRPNTVYFQFCLSHRQHVLKFIHDNFAFSTDCIRNPGLASPPTHSDAHPPGARASWSKNPCHY